MHGLAGRIASDDEIAAFFTPAAELWAMLLFERQLATAQGALGLIPSEAALAIARATETIAPDLPAIAAGMARDGVPVPALVTALREAVGEPHARYLHQGATSQDVVDTSLMLRLGDALQLLCERIHDLRDTIGELEDEEGQRPLMAQTRMQAALPFTVSAKLSTWIRPLVSHARRLSALNAERPIQLGGPVGDGASFGESYRALRADLAARFGLKDAEPWHSDRTSVLDVAQALALLTGTLGKIGQDVALMAQSDRRTVRLAGAGGSSAMAHKANPVGAEILVALARLNAGLLGTLAQSMVHENERSGAAWTLEWLVLPQMAEATGAALGHAQALLGGLSFPQP